MSRFEQKQGFAHQSPAGKVKAQQTAIPPKIGEGRLLPSVSVVRGGSICFPQLFVKESHMQPTIVLDHLPHIWHTIIATFPQILTLSFSFTIQLLQSIIIAWLQQYWSARGAVGNNSGNGHQGGDGPCSFPISATKAMTFCQSPERATSNSSPLASCARILCH